MKDLIKQNYEVTRQRGLITDETKAIEFIDKIEEETEEMRESYMVYGHSEEHLQEIADIILACHNYLKHFGFDAKSILNKKIEINRKRINN
jgi:uncharacterized protein YabN with tetrapyrrole methylase and pyrophosphatase domain